MSETSFDRRSALAALTITAVAPLTACNAPPRSQGEDRKVRSVAFVSAIPDESKITRPGFSRYLLVPVELDGRLAPLLHETAAEILRRSRPDWTVKTSQQVSADFRAARGKWGNSSFRLTRVQASDLAALANRLDVDLLFVLTETLRDNGPPLGFGAQLASGKPGVNTSVMVYAGVVLTVVDRNGSEVSWRHAAGAAEANSYPMQLFGLTTELAELSNPAVSTKLKTAILKQAEVALRFMFKSHGF